MKQTLFISGYPPFEVERERSWAAREAELWSFAHSEVRVCPTCLTQWAVLSFGERDHHIQGAYCEKHGDGRLLHEFGSIDLPLLEVLPTPLLEREFRLTLKRIENEISVY